MRVYIDSDYKCHVLNDGTMREFEVPFFDGKCETVIEGFRYIPANEVWRNEQGKLRNGESVFPWQSSRMLKTAQREYEQGKIKELEDENTDLKAALACFGVAEDEANE